MHYAKATCGFSIDVDRQLIDAADVATCPDWKKCVLLLMDEIHIREDLVYDKVSGEFCLYYTCLCHHYPCTLTGCLQVL